MVRGDGSRTFRRPWTAITALLTAAHHGFELSSGIGLVLQPELGLGVASALWGTQIPVWISLAARGEKRSDRLLAAWSGAALAGAIVHFVIWPWRRNRLGIPVLTEAEGLSPASLPAYNAILYAWGTAAMLSIALEVPRKDRRWVVVGLASLPLLQRSARHHFAWVTQQAVTNPAWWNRGVTDNPRPSVATTNRHSFAANLGVVPVSHVPPWLLVFLAIGVVASANLLAVAPAIGTARRGTAAELPRTL